MAILGSRFFKEVEEKSSRRKKNVQHFWFVDISWIYNIGMIRKLPLGVSAVGKWEL